MVLQLEVSINVYNNIIYMSFIAKLFIFTGAVVEQLVKLALLVVGLCVAFWVGGDVFLCSELFSLVLGGQYFRNCICTVVISSA